MSVTFSQKSLKSLFFMRLMAGRRLAFRTNSALFKDTWVRSWNMSELTNATGQQRKENGQLRVTLILFEKKNPPNFTFLWTDLFAKDQNIVMLSGDHDKTRKLWPCLVCHPQMFCHPLSSTLLLFKLTIVTVHVIPFSPEIMKNAPLCASLQVAFSFP